MKTKIGKSDVLYYLGIILISFYSIVLYSSYVREYFPKEVIAALLIGILVLFFASIILVKWPPKITISLILVMVIVLMCWKTIEKNILILYFFMIFASYKKDFFKIQTTIAYTTIAFTMLVIVFSLLGLVPNDVYERGDKTAYCLGFFYYTTLSYNAFFASLLLMGKKELTKVKDRLFAVVGFWAVNFIIYKITTTRLTFLLSFAVVLIYIYIYRRQKKYSKKIIMLAGLIFPVSTCINYAIASLFNRSNKILNLIDVVLGSRIVLAQQGIQKYGITLFGSNIENVNGIVDGHQVYFYVDNGYINALLTYGIILFMIIIFSYSLLNVYAVKNNYKMLILLCLITCGFCYINNVLFAPAINPTLLMTPTVFADFIKKRKKHLSR